MGQYLTISLARKIHIEKKEAIRYNLSLTDISDKLLTDWGVDLTNYDCQEEESTWVFNLKKELIDKELLNFLSDFYPSYYSANEKPYGGILTELRNSKDVQSTMNAANSQVFKLFKHSVPILLYFENLDFRPRIIVHPTESIILAFQGKIIVETYDEMFQFFSKVTQEKFKQYHLAYSLLVNLTI